MYLKLSFWEKAGNIWRGNVRKNLSLIDSEDLEYPNSTPKPCFKTQVIIILLLMARPMKIIFFVYCPRMFHGTVTKFN